MMKKKKLLSLSIIVLIIIIISGIISLIIIQNKLHGDTSAYVSVEPEVKVTGTTYNYSDLPNLWEIPIWEKFNAEYGGRTSKELINNIIENMKEQAEDLGEDPEVLQKCLNATGYFDDPEYIVPCYAEKAEFEYYSNFTGKRYDYQEFEGLNKSMLGEKVTEPCWIFVLNWGFPEEPLGHIKIIAVSTVDYSIVYFITCG